MWRNLCRLNIMINIDGSENKLILRSIYFKKLVPID